MQYIAHCRLLLREIEHRLDDLAFMQQGGTIRYAVDFSELYAYALPDKTGKEIELFVDESEGRADTIQRQALRRLFEEYSEPLILLNPYAIELQSFFINERRRLTVNISDYAARLKHIEEALAQPEYQAIGRINAELKVQPTRELTVEESDLIARFLEHSAPDLVEILNQRVTRPVEAIQRLLAASRFADLETLVSVKLGFDSATTEDWYQKLADILKAKNAPIGPNTDLDALALALVEGANRLLDSHKTRLLLVTRSMAMHDLLPPPQIERAVAAPLPDIPHLRHPRIFSDLFAIDGRSGAELEPKLTDCAKALRILLKAAEGEDIDHLDATGRDRLTPLVDDLKQRWQQAEESAMALHIRLPNAQPTAQRPAPEQTRQILALLHDHGALKDLLATRLQERITDLEHIHELLGLCLLSVTPAQQERIVAMLQIDDEMKYGQLTTRQSLPYTLRFYSDPARRLLKIIGAAQHKGGSWSNVIDFLKTGFPRGSNFERVLAMAAILAALGRWNLAETYAERALQIADVEGVPAPEGYFFLAICKRKWHISFKRYHEAIMRLDQAINVAFTPRPPRYLKEQGTQMLMLALKFPKVPTRHTAADGLALLDEVERTSDDPLLKLDCINNRLFYFVEANQLDQRDQRITDYENLLQLQRRLDPNQEHWPAFVLHTLVLARWKLYGIHADRERQEMLTWLEYAQNNTYLESGEREQLSTLRQALLTS
jgi:hypothetical protein